MLRARAQPWAVQSVLQVQRRHSWENDDVQSTQALCAGSLLRCCVCQLTIYKWTLIKFTRNLDGSVALGHSALNEWKCCIKMCWLSECVDRHSNASAKCAISCCVLIRLKIIFVSKAFARPDIGAILSLDFYDFFFVLLHFIWQSKWETTQQSLSHPRPHAKLSIEFFFSLSKHTRPWYSNAQLILSNH